MEWMEGCGERDLVTRVGKADSIRHMPIHGFKTVSLLPRLPGAGHEVIVQAMRGRHIAGISGVNKVLGDPPRLITKAAIEICNPRPRFLQPVMVQVDR